MIPGKGTITEIDARTDDVTAEQHARMPIVPRSVTSLKNGDLFMDFWLRKTVSYSKDEKHVRNNPSSDFNPPVILTKSGELISGCGD